MALKCTNLLRFNQQRRRRQRAQWFVVLLCARVGCGEAIQAQVKKLGGCVLMRLAHVSILQQALGVSLFCLSSRSTAGQHGGVRQCLFFSATVPGEAALHERVH